jgi:hypothetical protein
VILGITICYNSVHMFSACLIRRTQGSSVAAVAGSARAAGRPYMIRRTQGCGVRLVIAILGPAAIASPETIEFKRLREGTLEERLRLAHPKIGERYRRLRGLFEETGCAGLREQKVKARKSRILICSIPSLASIGLDEVAGHYPPFPHGLAICALRPLPSTPAESQIPRRDP